MCPYQGNMVDMSSTGCKMYQGNGAGNSMTCRGNFHLPGSTTGADIFLTLDMSFVNKITVLLQDIALFSQCTA